MSRRAWLAFLWVTLLTGKAAAAGLPTPGFDWSGLYLGIDAGLAANQSNFDSAVRGLEGTQQALKSVTDGDQSSLMGGGLVGYNLQLGHLVLGGEADLNYLGYSDTRSKIEDYDLYSATRKTTFDASWFGTLRGRAGLAAAGFLIYGTAGLAAGDMQATASLKAVDVATGDIAKWQGSTDANNWGWTAGAGLEYGVSNVSFGVEYLYIDLGSSKWQVNPQSTADGIDGASATGTAEYRFSVARATAKLHF